MSAPPLKKRATVLLVDDEASIRFAMRDYLETQGLLVEEADDARALRAALRKSRPDAIVRPDCALSLKGAVRTQTRDFSTPFCPATPLSSNTSRATSRSRS